MGAILQSMNIGRHSRVAEPLTSTARVLLSPRVRREAALLKLFDLEQETPSIGKSKGVTMHPDVRPIFYDPAGRRGKVAKMSLGAGAALLLMVVIAFVSGLINAPGLPQLGTSSAQLAFEAPGDQNRTSSFLYRGLSQQLLPAQAVHALRFAAFANTGVAYEALQRKAHDIDAILPEWVEVTLDGEAKSANGHQQATSLEPKVASWLRSSAPRIAVYPQLRTSRQLDLTRLARHLADASWQMRLLDSITAYLRNGGYDGISIAFPELPASARADFVRLLRDLSLRMHQQGKRVLLVLAPDTDIAAAQQMEGYADYVVAGTHSASYSLHPQPLATQAWFESRVAEFSRHINPSKLIFAIGSYGGAVACRRSPAHDLGAGRLVFGGALSRGIPV